MITKSEPLLAIWIWTGAIEGRYWYVGPEQIDCSNNLENTQSYVFNFLGHMHIHVFQNHTYAGFSKNQDSLRDARWHLSSLHALLGKVKPGGKLEAREGPWGA